MAKMLKNFQVKLYLEGWIDNVGFSYGPERTLNEAMTSSIDLHDWFRTDDVDYDEDFALAIMNEEYSRYRREAGN